MTWNAYMSHVGNIGPGSANQYGNLSQVSYRDAQQARMDHEVAKLNAAKEDFQRMALAAAQYSQSPRYQAGECRAPVAPEKTPEPEAGPLPEDCPIYRREEPKNPFPWLGWALTAACLYGLFFAGHTVWLHFKAKEMAKTLTVEPIPLNE